jgi:hypothetical protein
MGVRKTQAGANLKRWFKEKWVDNKGLPCGSDKNKDVKKCRPSRKVSSKTPKTWGDLGPSGKAKAMREKRKVGMGRNAPPIKKVSPITNRSSCKY